MRFTEAFEITGGEIVGIVGGGGKTTLMYRLAQEVAAGGGRAVATGTTLFTPPPASLHMPLVVQADQTRLIEELSSAAPGHGALIAATGHGTKGRLLPVSGGLPAMMMAGAGVTGVFVEADGSRGRPFKAPAEHEPVIPDGATLVIAVAGMPALGAPLDDEHVHRPERVTVLTGAAAGALVTHEVMAAVLADPLGGRKDVAAGVRFAVMLNAVEPSMLDGARRVAGMLREAGVERVVLARARDEPPVVEVVC